MISPVEKIRRTLTFHYYRIKNGWYFPKEMVHLTAGKMASGSYDPEFSQLLQKILKEGDLFVDIGANVGYFSRMASGIVGKDGFVVAFEAERENFYALSLNTSKCNNVATVNMAVSDRNGFIDLTRSSHSSCHSIVETGNPVTDTTIKVMSVSLDHFWKNNLDNKIINLLKIDVEGAELMVLEGMADLISEGIVKHLLIEFGPKMLQSAGFEPALMYERLAGNFLLTVIDEEYHSVLNNGTIKSLEDFQRLAQHLMDKEGIRSCNLMCYRKQ